MNLTVQQPRKFTRVDGVNGELLLIFQCLLHGSHVVVGGGRPGDTGTALHLHVDEALQLIDALNAGEQWGRLSDQVDGFRQASVTVRCGLWCVTLRNGNYYLSWKCEPFPMAMVQLSAEARAKLAAAVLELVHGRTAAA